MFVTIVSRTATKSAVDVSKGARGVFAYANVAVPGVFSYWDVTLLSFQETRTHYAPHQSDRA